MSTAVNHLADPNAPADAAGQLYPLAPAPEQLLQTYRETIRTQAAELRQAEQAVRRLTDEVLLLNAGLADTIADSLQATEFARAEVERQRQQLHDLFINAPGPVTILAGPSLVFELVNPAYQRLFPGRELLGKPLLAALAELADTEIPSLCRQVYDTGETYVAAELLVHLAHHAAGPLEDIYWAFTYQARRNEQHLVDGVVVFAHDVTSQVVARQQVQALNQQLIRTNEDLETFVYTASHDLQGPLDNLDGLLQELCEELPVSERSVPVAHILELLHDSVERFQHTLSQLSTIANGTAGAGPPAPAVPLADVVRDVLLDLALPIAEAGAQVSVHLADGPTVCLAEKKLRSVVYNLVSNAVKYRHPDRVPQVRVQCRAEGPRWALEVQDNGLGLALPPGRPAFGLFRRFHTHVDGSGVGLYMVQKLVENEGGHLEVASQVGQGSTFTVYFRR